MDHPARSSSELYPSPKRVRVVLGGVVIADSRRAILLRRENGPPAYYFPVDDVKQGILEARATKVGQYGDEQWFSVRAAGREATEAAWSLLRYAGLENYVAFSWSAMDAWFEEDQEVFIHPRDPRRRIDLAASSSHLRVRAGDEVVAESRRPLLLFETGLVTRYYLPKLDVRMELLVPSETVTYCPYKGEAHYYSLIVGSDLLEDVIWYYRYPTFEVAPIAGLLCFYQEKINVEVDGLRL